MFQKERKNKSEVEKMKKISRETTHAIAWLMSLLALPVAIIAVCKGATPLQITGWLSLVVAVQLLHLLPEALKTKKVYNDEV